MSELIVPGCECVSNAVVYGLYESIRRAKYPKSVDLEKVNNTLTSGIEALALSAKGAGHDNWLNGVVVQFDLKFSNKAWVEAERYHFLDFVSSQSTMHKMVQFDISAVLNEYVDPRIGEILKEKIAEYKELLLTLDVASMATNCSKEEVEQLRKQAENMYLEILYSNPAGFTLVAGMTTNYRQLKTIYAQRRNHKLPEWRAFCEWIETLPMSWLITGKKGGDVTDDRNPTAKVILFSGKAQHGKDTAAKMLKAQMDADGKRVLLVHYADLLKHICRNFFGWDGNKDENGRHLLQYVGTDVVRKKQPTFWVEFIVSMLRLFGEEWDYVIIPDCRFPDEITTLSNYGFKTTHVRVIRNNFTSTLTEEQQHHPSETALDNVEPDITINNEGSLEDLEAIITWMKEKLYGN